MVKTSTCAIGNNKIALFKRSIRIQMLHENALNDIRNRQQWNNLPNYVVSSSVSDLISTCI